MSYSRYSITFFTNFYCIKLDLNEIRREHSLGQLKKNDTHAKLQFKKVSGKVGLLTESTQEKLLHISDRNEELNMI